MGPYSALGPVLVLRKEVMSAEAFLDLFNEIARWQLEGSKWVAIKNSTGTFSIHRPCTFATLDEQESFLAALLVEQVYPVINLESATKGLCINVFIHFLDANAATAEPQLACAERINLCFLRSTRPRPGS
ncbi:MAG: hypothetical protein HY566_02835 [Candidatus Kerfeldbacteria bacterium]|nr:hypothetical protein [Candidatus Kerfeldbacteria bacterium]